MKPRTPVIVLAVAAIPFLVLALRRGGTHEVPAPPPPRPAPTGPDAAPVPAAPAIDVRVFRFRNEAILLARLSADGRPAADAEVLLLDDTGGICARGATDSRGVFRDRFTGEPATVSVQPRGGAALVLPVPPPPPAAAPRRPLLADRSVLRPGDGFRVCAWNPDPTAGPLETEFRCGSEPAEEARWQPEPEELLGGPRWQVLPLRVPSDAAPGLATIRIAGDTLEIPILPRFGPAPAPAPEPVDPPPAGAQDDPALRREEGAWRVALDGSAEGTTVLVFSAAGDRLLGHGAVAAEGAEALVPLPEVAADREVAITAVAARPDGFRVRRAALSPPGPALRIDPLPSGPRGEAAGVCVRLAAGEGLAAPPLYTPVPLAVAVDDPSGDSFPPLLLHEIAAARIDLLLPDLRGRAADLRAVALPRDGAPIVARASLLPPEPAGPASGPEWIREGDRPAGEVPPAPARPTLVSVRAFLHDGVPGSLPALARAPGIPVSWVAAGCTGPGALRVRAGAAIVLETEVDEGVSTGVFEPGSANALAGSIVAASDAPGFVGLVLEAEVPVDAATAAAEPAPGFSLGRTLPARGAPGAEVEAAVVLHAEEAFEGPVEVVLPLPRGAVPAEDGWSLRARAPAGTRVFVEESVAAWALPGLARGETRLALKTRLLRRGEWVVPPAEAASADPTGFSIRSAGGRITIE